MRKLTTLFLGLILLTSCGENEVDSSKLVERRGLTYEVNSETPFTGVSLTKYDNDQIKEKVHYEEGLKIGEENSYSKRGLITKNITYENGEEVTKTIYTYHKNDKLEWKQTLKGDKPHGTWISNYQNGQLEVEVNLENGKRHGHFERYYRNGQLEMQGKFKYDVQDGPWIAYYENGQLLEEGTYKNGKKDGPFEFYYENGQLKEKGTFKDGKREGRWVFNTGDGEKRLISEKSSDGYILDQGSGTYKDGKKISD